MTNKEIENRFTYHQPKGSQLERYTKIRRGARCLAEDILQMTPESREQSLAIMWANASIARNE